MFILSKFNFYVYFHCRNPEKQNVYFQTEDPESLSSGYAIEKIITHPRFAINKSETSDVGFSQNDIALVRLKQKIKCDQYKNPICLPDADFKLSVGARSTIAGWGSSNPTENCKFSKYIYFFILKDLIQKKSNYPL